jgi:hypothetical protein
MTRFMPDEQPMRVHRPTTRLEFYREEFLKHQHVLQQQREYYSDRAITDVEAALTRILGQIEVLCTKEDADQVVSGLLRKFDLLTGLSAWSDPHNVH